MSARPPLPPRLPLQLKLLNVTLKINSETESESFSQRFALKMFYFYDTPTVQVARENLLVMLLSWLQQKLDLSEQTSTNHFYRFDNLNLDFKVLQQPKQPTAEIDFVKYIKKTYGSTGLTNPKRLLIPSPVFFALTLNDADSQILNLLRSYQQKVTDGQRVTMDENLTIYKRFVNFWYSYPLFAGEKSLELAIVQYSNDRRMVDDVQLKASLASNIYENETSSADVILHEPFLTTMTTMSLLEIYTKMAKARKQQKTQQQQTSAIKKLFDNKHNNIEVTKTPEDKKLGYVVFGELPRLFADSCEQVKSKTQSQIKSAAKNPSFNPKFYYLHPATIEQTETWLFKFGDQQSRKFVAQTSDHVDGPDVTCGRYEENYIPIATTPVNKSAWDKLHLVGSLWRTVILTIIEEKIVQKKATMVVPLRFFRNRYILDLDLISNKPLDDEEWVRGQFITLDIIREIFEKNNTYNVQVFHGTTAPKNIYWYNKLYDDLFPIQKHSQVFLELPLALKDWFVKDKFEQLGFVRSEIAKKVAELKGQTPLIAPTAPAAPGGTRPSQKTAVSPGEKPQPQTQHEKQVRKRKQSLQQHKRQVAQAEKKLADFERRRKQLAEQDQQQRPRSRQRGGSTKTRRQGSGGQRRKQHQGSRQAAQAAQIQRMKKVRAENDLAEMTRQYDQLKALHETLENQCRIYRADHQRLLRDPGLSRTRDDNINLKAQKKKLEERVQTSKNEISRLTAEKKQIKKELEESKKGNTCYVNLAAKEKSLKQCRDKRDQQIQKAKRGRQSSPRQRQRQLRSAKSKQSSNQEQRIAGKYKNLLDDRDRDIKTLREDLEKCAQKSQKMQNDLQKVGKKNKKLKELAVTMAEESGKSVGHLSDCIQKSSRNSRGKQNRR